MASVAGAGKLDRPRKMSGAMPKLIVPKSSYIAQVQYDPENMVTTTHMINGAIYQEHGVSPGRWEELVSAQNQGSFWSRNIKGSGASAKVKRVRAPNAAIKLKGMKI